MSRTVFLTAFNHASSVASEGRAREAHELYQALLGECPAELAPILAMRVAYCLMDLGRFAEALERFDSMAPRVSKLEARERFDYQFSRANSLGNLGRLSEMEEAMDEALGTAWNDLRDGDACLRCWECLLLHTRRANEWEGLRRQAMRCLKFGRRTGLERVLLVARRYGLPLRVTA